MRDLYFCKQFLKTLSIEQIFYSTMNTYRPTQCVNEKTKPTLTYLEQQDQIKTSIKSKTRFSRVGLVNKHKQGQLDCNQCCDK